MSYFNNLEQGGLIGNNYGIQITESIHCLEEGDPYEKKRTWSERLFSRPWKPLTKTKTVTPMIPRKGALKIGNKIIMHPDTAAKMRESLKNE